MLKFLYPFPFLKQFTPRYNIFYLSRWDDLHIRPTNYEFVALLPELQRRIFFSEPNVPDDLFTERTAPETLFLYIITYYIKLFLIYHMELFITKDVLYQLS